MRRLLPCVGVALLMWACSPDKGLGQTRKVNSDDYGPAWPLTVDSALLNCDPSGQLLIQVDGQAFSLDAIADKDVDPNFKRVWAKDLERGSARKDLSPLGEDTQALC